MRLSNLVVLTLLLPVLFACNSPKPIEKVEVVIDRGTCINGDCENGIGVFQYHDEHRYAGEFSLSEPHGNGVMVWKDGSRYEGNFKYGKKHGQGKLTSSNGEVVEQLWYLDRNAVEAKRQLEAKQYAERVQGDGDDGFQWGKFIALSSGSLIGGMGELSSAQQIEILGSITADSMAGIDGANNVMNTTNRMISEEAASRNDRLTEESEQAGLDASMSGDLTLTCNSQATGLCGEYTFSTAVDRQRFVDSCRAKGSTVSSSSCPSGGTGCYHTGNGRTVVTYTYDMDPKLVHDKCKETGGSPR